MFLDIFTVDRHKVTTWYEQKSSTPILFNLKIWRILRFFSQNAGNIHAESVSIWKFLAADIERIESVGAVGAVFEEVFFTLGKFFAAFVLSETVAAAAHAGCLNGEDKVIVILSVEERHKALLPGKTLVDEKVFLIVPHGIAEIDRLHSPAVALELVDHNPTEVLFVDGIV